MVHTLQMLVQMVQIGAKDENGANGGANWCKLVQIGANGAYGANGGANGANLVFKKFSQSW